MYIIKNVCIKKLTKNLEKNGMMQKFKRKNVECSFHSFSLTKKERVDDYKLYDQKYQESKVTFELQSCLFFIDDFPC